MGLDKIITDLYASEINASISWFWDSGYEVVLGDELNGARDVSHDEHLTTTDDIAEWLKRTASRHYPDSAFARKYT